MDANENSTSARPRPPADLLLIVEGLQSQLDDLAQAVAAQTRVIADQARQLAELERRLPLDAG